MLAGLEKDTVPRIFIKCFLINCCSFSQASGSPGKKAWQMCSVPENQVTPIFSPGPRLEAGSD